ncbi:MAG: 50S ribosomal protein L44e [Candidatus Aenigmatarchaeota archaeon]
MDMPLTQKRYCPFCKKHTLHTVRRVSAKKVRGLLSHGQRIFKRKMKGFGSYPRTNPKGRSKPTKKVDLRYKCSACGKEHTVGKGFRVKKLELKKGE